MTTFRFQAISKYLPGKAIPSETIEQIAGMRTGWVMKNSGVRFRHFAAETDSIASMTVKALNCALDRSHRQLADMDMLICAGGTYDQPIPYNACLVKQEMGAEQTRTHCFDVDATCLSFIVGLDVALAMMEARKLHGVALTTAEIASRSLNREDFKTFSLFGDAAVASIIEQSEEGFSFIGSHFENFCEGARYAQVVAGGNRLLGFDPDARREDFYFSMQGKKLLKATFQHLGDFFDHLEAKTGIPLHQYDMIIPHQASKFGNEFFIRKFGLKSENVYQGLKDYGNCISASVALGLEECLNQGRIQKGDKVLLAGTAAGLSLGGIALQF
ncbi:MAG: 3-oxoacyl-[acyl-carrier-protein] synthase III C-terminal domain-containing protein [Bacteroidota bacterium]